MFSLTTIYAGKKAVNKTYQTGVKAVDKDLVLGRFLNFTRSYWEVSLANKRKADVDVKVRIEPTTVGGRAPSAPLGRTYRPEPLAPPWRRYLSLTILDALESLSTVSRAKYTPAATGLPALSRPSHGTE